MPNDSKPVALIVGAGPGLSTAVTRTFGSAGYAVALAARHPEKLVETAREIGALPLGCDATRPDEVERLFGEVAARLGPPDVVVFNAAARVMGAVTELKPAEVEQVLLGNAMAGFLTAQAAARAMLPRAAGAIIFTGASAGLKGYPRSAPFAMGKFALRGLAQSLARELGPQGVHVAHVNIDGAIRSGARPEPADKPDTMVAADAIADLYLHLVRQPRSAWTFEVDVRPFGESF